MARTFDEANRSVGEEREERAEERGTDFSSRSSVPDGPDVRDRAEETYNTIFEAFGSFDERRAERQERRQERASEFDRSTNEAIRNIINVDLEELEDELENIGQVDLEGFNQQEILTVIAEQINNLAVQFTKLTRQNSGIAALLDEIAENSQDPFGVAVSGVNDIDEPRTEQTIVRNSSGGGIPARVFKIKASDSNTSSIWIGDDGVDVERGYELKPGDDIEVRINLTEGQPYMVSEESGQEIQIFGLV